MNNDIIKLFKIPTNAEKLKQLKKISAKYVENKEIKDFCDAYLLYIENKNEEVLKLIAEHESIEFLILRGHSLSNLGKYKEAEKYYKLSIEKDNNNSFAYHGLGILYRDLKKYDDAEKYFKLSIEKDENFSYPYNGLGVLYRDLKKYDDAEKYFKLSIEKDKNFSSPYNGLGVLYSDLKKYEDAEKYFKLSIEKDKNYSSPYYGLGNLYSELKKYDDAEKYFKLCIEKDENLSYPYNGLGNLYSNLKKYDDAEKYFKLSIEKDVNNALVYSNLGILYKDLKDYNKAREIIKKGLELIKDEKTIDTENYHLSRFNSLLSEIDKLEKNDENYSKIIKSKSEDPIKEILKEINENKIDEQTFLNKKKFLNFIKPKQQIGSENYFKVLRRWNSYTPIIADNYHISKGGGYFLKSNGIGIVIDPGFNFIENFKGEGHVFDEIDAVFISHAHNDHTADLESILTLLHKYNEEIKDSDDPDNTDSIRHEIAKKKDINFNHVTLDEINEVFLISEKRKTLDIFMTASTFKKSIGLFELFNKNDYKIHLVEANGKLEFKEIPVKVLKAKHHDIVSDCFSVGFAFYLKDTVLIYTGDTAWNFEIENQYKELADEIKSKYKILIAHIGGFKEYEDSYLNYGYSGYNAFYKNHLGRLGIGKLNETLQPDIYLMSEFGEEIKGSRIKLCEIYENAYKGKNGKNIKFFPADIGFKINIENKKIWGISSIKQEPDELIYEYLNQTDINTAELRKDYSLNYYKNNLSESILIQILADKYDESRK